MESGKTSILAPTQNNEDAPQKKRMRIEFYRFCHEDPKFLRAAARAFVLKRRFRMLQDLVSEESLAFSRKKKLRGKELEEAERERNKKFKNHLEWWEYYQNKQKEELKAAAAEDGRKESTET